MPETDDKDGIFPDRYYKLFKRAHYDALKGGVKVFEFGGIPILTDYAKYLLEYQELLRKQRKRAVIVSFFETRSGNISAKWSKGERRL